MNKTRVGLSLVVVAAVTAAALHYSKSESASAKQPKSPPAVPVVVAKSSVHDMPVLLEITGRTEAYETVTLKSRIDGQVQRVSFTEGQHVQQGDALLQLDPADFQAKLNQATANLARSQAEAAKAKADLDRYIALRAKGFISEEKVSEMRTAASAAASAASADSAATEIARLQVSYTTIKAPFSGVIGARLVFPGTAVRAGDTALGVVNRVRPLQVSFSVPEKHLPALQAALRSSGKTMTATVSLPGSTETIAGQVKFIDNSVDASTGTIALKAVVANENEKLASGQFVNVGLTLNTLKNAIVVPAEAVQQGPDGSFVFVLKADSTVDLRKVRIGLTQKTLAVIAEGLSDGESVVTEGHLRLTAGAKVKVAGAENKPG